MKNKKLNSLYEANSYLEDKRRYEKLKKLYFTYEHRCKNTKM